MGVRACACECVYPHPGASPAVDVSGKCRSSTDNQDSCIFSGKDQMLMSFVTVELSSISF